MKSIVSIYNFDLDVGDMVSEKDMDYTQWDDYYEGEMLVVVDENNKVVEILGSDGGEPEDRYFYRHFSWVINVCDRMMLAEEKVKELENEIEKLKSEVLEHYK